MSAPSLEQLTILEGIEDDGRSIDLLLPVTRRQQIIVLLSSFMAVFQTIGMKKDWHGFT
jgi:hypothetical protein